MFIRIHKNVNNRLKNVAVVDSTLEELSMFDVISELPLNFKDKHDVNVFEFDIVDFYFIDKGIEQHHTSNITQESGVNWVNIGDDYFDITGVEGFRVIGNQLDICLYEGMFSGVKLTVPRTRSNPLNDVNEMLAKYQG